MFHILSVLVLCWALLPACGSPTTKTSESAATPSSLATETWTFTDNGLRPSYREIEPFVDEAFVTRDGRHRVLLDNGREYRIVSPTKRTLGARALDYPYVRLSPRGDFVALFEVHEGVINIVVSRLSDHEIVYTAERADDAFWIGDVELAYRSGKQALVVDVASGKTKAVGPAQTLGCEDRGPQYERQAVCPGNRFSRVVAVDAGMKHWLVFDSEGYHVDTIRRVELATGASTTLADGATHGFPLYPTVSPSGMRYCFTPKRDDVYRLHCGRFPQADGAQLAESSKGAHLPSAAWLDDDRLLLSSFGMIDLARGRRIVFETGLPDFARLAPLGPRHVTVDAGIVLLLDLEKKTQTRLNPVQGPTRDGLLGVYAAAAVGDELWVQRRDEPGGGTFLHLYALTLAP